jgi:hypothetical protein
MRIKVPNPEDIIPFIFASLAFPMLALTRVNGVPSGAMDTKFVLIFILFGFTLAIRKHLRSRKHTKLFINTDLVLLPVLLFIYLCAGVRGQMSEFTNLGFLVLVIYYLRISSQGPNFIKALQNSAYVLVAFLIIARIYLGAPEHRMLGGIFPNLFAVYAIAATTFAMFISKRAFDIISAISMIACLMVSARTGMVLIALIYCLFYILNIKRAGAFRIGLLLFSTLGLLMDLIANQGDSLIGTALLFNDSSRGLDSGISGRDGHWVSFVPQLDRHPLIGYGFRNRSAYLGAHNGFLNTILELGVIGASGLFLYMALRYKTSFRFTMLGNGNPMRGHFLIGITAFLIGGLLQPQIINFGDAAGFTMLILIFSILPTEALGHKAEPDIQAYQQQKKRKWRLKFRR